MRPPCILRVAARAFSLCLSFMSAFQFPAPRASIPAPFDTGVKGSTSTALCLFTFSLPLPHAIVVSYSSSCVPCLCSCIAMCSVTPHFDRITCVSPLIPQKKKPVDPFSPSHVLHPSGRPLAVALFSVFLVAPVQIACGVARVDHLFLFTRTTEEHCAGPCTDLVACPFHFLLHAAVLTPRPRPLAVISLKKKFPAHSTSPVLCVRTRLPFTAHLLAKFRSHRPALFPSGAPLTTSAARLCSIGSLT
ncbi:hypothetical protein TRVL_03007 [Trypanosoma vivax]|nr:hypothetical protein TRVL_03007 [Trypanosoma vivax]